MQLLNYQKNNYYHNCPNDSRFKFFIMIHIVSTIYCRATDNYGIKAQIMNRAQIMNHEHNSVDVFIFYIFTA